MGMRLNEETLTERRLPTRDVLDRAVPDRPAIVHRYCGHVAVVNSAALHEAGVTAATADPEGGTIDRDEAGEPTGVLRETAIELVSGSLGSGNEINAEELVDALHRLAAVGITSIGAILRTGAGVWASLGNELDIAVAAADRSPIKIGAYTIEEAPATVAASKQPIDAAGHRLRWLGIKRFGDGSFGGHTAAMHQPYVDVATTGTLRLTGLDKEIVEHRSPTAAGRRSMRSETAPVSAVIDMFGRLIASGADRSKLRIEHASVLTDDDMAGSPATGSPPWYSPRSWDPRRSGCPPVSAPIASPAPTGSGRWKPPGSCWRAAQTAQSSHPIRGQGWRWHRTAPVWHWQSGSRQTGRLPCTPSAPRLPWASRSLWQWAALPTSSSPTATRWR